MKDFGKILILLGIGIFFGGWGLDGLAASHSSLEKFQGLMFGASKLLLSIGCVLWAIGLVIGLTKRKSAAAD